MEKSEGKIQSEIVKYFRNNYCLKFNKPRCCIFSVPNERKDKKELSKMIATGLYGGVSDLIVIMEGQVIFIEVKDAKGTQQPNQKEFEKTIKDQNLPYHIVRSLDEFKTLIHAIRPIPK